MTFRLIAVALASAVLFAPAVVSAEVEHQPIEEKRLVSGKQLLSPDRGYIYLHAPTRTSIMLIKEPNAAELAAYEAEWREELADAKRDYARRIENWEDDLEWARRNGKKRPEWPVEPTEENFRIGRIEQRMIVNIGPQYIYAKQGEGFSYLHELQPGTYRYYGPVFLAPNGTGVGTCYCMGSVRFSVEAGKIANLGDFLTLGWVTPEQGRASALEWHGASASRETDYSLPERLAAFPNAPADWRAAGKIDNFYGIMVGRMPIVPGVLAYDRDTVLDLKAVDSAGAAGAR